MAAATTVLMLTATAASAAHLAPPPLVGSEETFDGAAVVDALPWSLATTTGLSPDPEPDDPTGTCATPGAPAVWSTWTAPDASPVVFDTFGEDFLAATVETEMTVWTGADLGSLTEVDCDAAGSYHEGLDVNQSRLVLTPTAGETYHVQVTTPDAAGSVVLNARSAVIANDDFADARPLTTGIMDRATLTDLATAEGGEPTPTCGNLGDPSAWWQWTATADGPVAFDATQSGTDAVLAVHTGGSLGTLTEVACDNGVNTGWSGDNPRLEVDAVAGTTYWVQVADEGEPGDVELLVRDLVVPANDDVADATDVTAYPFSEEVDLTLASDEADEPNNISFPSVWYRAVAPSDGVLTAYTSGGFTDTELAIHEGDTLATLTELAYDDDYADGYTEQLSVAVSAGDVRWVQVGLNSSDEPGPTTVGFQFADGPPANDEAATATEITSLPFVGSANDALASDATDCDGGTTPGVWWEWTAPADMRAWATTLGTDDGGQQLSVYSGPGLDDVACGDDSEYSDSNASFDAVAGTTYTFLVTGSSDLVDADDLVLKLAAGAAVSGTVVDADGAPLAGICIEVLDGDALVGSTTTADDGTYTLGGLAAGTYTVAANGCDDADPALLEGQVSTEVAANQVTRGVDLTLLAPEPEPEPATDVRFDGVDRVETAILISQQTFPEAGDADAVVIARSFLYPDALAGGPLARALDAPILLNPTGGLDERVLDEIERLDVDTAIVLGGVNALSSEVGDELAAAGLDVDRLPGVDRFETAALVAERLAEVAGAPEAAWVVEGINADPRRGWPDAVSAGPAAARALQPILLTRAADLPSSTATAIDDLGVSTVAIVGGERAVSPTVEASLAGQVGTVDRLAGIDRYATSVAVADAELAAIGAGAPLWIATGRNFPDALAAGPAVAAEAGVLLLVDGVQPGISAASFDWLDDDGDDLAGLRIAGGTNAISEDVADLVRQRLP